MTKAGLPIFAGSISSIIAHSSKAALADFVRISAGTTRALYEMVLGSAMAGEEPAAPPSPVSGIGEHHTGGGHGAVIPTVVWHRTGPWDPVGGNTVSTFLAPISAGSPNRSFDQEAFIPACHPGGAYESLTFLVWHQIGVAEAGKTYTITVNGVAIEVDGNATGYGSDSGTIQLTPGTVNILEIDITTDVAATGELRILGFALLTA